MAYQDELCPGCGEPKDECMEPLGQGPDYDAHMILCRSCEVRGVRSDEWLEERTPHGAFVVTDRKE